MTSIWVSDASEWILAFQIGGLPSILAWIYVSFVRFLKISIGGPYGLVPVMVCEIPCWVLAVTVVLPLDLVMFMLLLARDVALSYSTYLGAWGSLLASSWCAACGDHGGAIDDHTSWGFGDDFGHGFEWVF